MIMNLIMTKDVFTLFNMVFFLMISFEIHVESVKFALKISKHCQIVP